MSLPAPTKPCTQRLLFAEHIVLDYTTFQSIIGLLKDKGLESADVSSWGDRNYGFVYTIDGSTYSSSSQQQGFTWSEAAISCLQQIGSHLKELQKAA